MFPDCTFFTILGDSRTHSSGSFRWQAQPWSGLFIIMCRGGYCIHWTLLTSSSVLILPSNSTQGTPHPGNSNPGYQTQRGFISWIPDPERIYILDTRTRNAVILLLPDPSIELCYILDTRSREHIVDTRPMEPK